MKVKKFYSIYLLPVNNRPLAISLHFPLRPRCHACVYFRTACDRAWVNWGSICNRVQTLLRFCSENIERHLMLQGHKIKEK